VLGLPALVMCARCCCSPEEYSLGVIPSQEVSLLLEERA
jgi:hypothetical protein